MNLLNIRKLRYLFLSLCISCIVLFSCSDQKLRQVQEEFDYGKKTYFIDKDSLIQGTLIELSKLGDTLSVGNYLDGKLNGTRKIFGQKGNLIILENYKTDVFHGPYITYFEDGGIMTKGNYTNGQLDSIYLVYYDTGELKEQVTMHDNAENGPFEEYYKNGKVHWKGTFVDGPNEIGELLEYDESGDLIKKMIGGLYRGEYMTQTIWDKEKGEVIPKLKYDE